MAWMAVRRLLEAQPYTFRQDWMNGVQPKLFMWHEWAAQVTVQRVDGFQLVCRSWGWWCWQGMRWTETGFKLASLINFVIFLHSGKYRWFPSLLFCLKRFLLAAQLIFVNRFHVQSSAGTLKMHGVVSTCALVIVRLL